MPIVSVVVPVYKVEKYLNRCVDSILNQTFKDFELILVDDGSPDNSPEICDELAKKYSKIKVIHRKNGGLSAARNTGIEWALANSDSEWITFIDSDDWIHPQYIESMLNANQENNTDICMGGFCFTDEYKIAEASVPKDKTKYVRTEEAFTDETLDPNSACCRLYKKELFRDIRYPVGKLHEDRFTTYKLLFRFKNISVVDFPLYYYFVNEEGIVRSSWSPRKLDNLEACENQLDFFIKNNNQEMIVYILKDYIHLMLYNLRTIKGKNEFASYEKQIRTKLKKTLKQYKKMLNLSFEKDYNIYKYAYPVTAKIYNKLRTIFKR